MKLILIRLSIYFKSGLVCWKYMLSLPIDRISLLWPPPPVGLNMVFLAQWWGKECLDELCCIVVKKSNRDFILYCLDDRGSGRLGKSYLFIIQVFTVGGFGFVCKAAQKSEMASTGGEVWCLWFVSLLFQRWNQLSIRLLTSLTK